MRRWMATPLMIVAAATICPNNTSRALAQKNDPVEETFQTADGVQLSGLFLKSETNPGSDPVVILLYPPGKGNTMDAPGDWKGLASTLSKKGYNVFRFDWRGHGRSTDIKDTNKFWNLATPANPNPNPYSGAWNFKLVTGAPAPGKKIKNDIFFKDLKNPLAYIPAYTLDLAAARYHLDGKNDTGDLNMSSVYVIGAGDAATIGMAWMTAEWNRPATAPAPNQLGMYPRYEFVPQPINGGIPTEAGTDISGAVWLTATRPMSIPPALVQFWASKDAPKLRDNNPMLYLYGDKDMTGKKQSKFFYDEVLVANPPKSSPLQKLDQTFLREIKGGGTLAGAALLGQNAKIGTEDTIVKFLDAIQKNRAKIVRKNRGYSSPYFLDLRAFGFAAP